MLLNILLLLVVFGAQKKKKLNPYAAALILGTIKGAVNAAVTHNLLNGILLGAIYTALAAAFVFFLQRLDRREEATRPDVPTYGAPGSATVKFQWEYIPLAILLLLIVGGEMLLI